MWSALVESFRLDLLLHLGAAVVLGGAIGLERELKGKPAGLRTNVLICVGAALFTELSRDMAGSLGDPARIAAQIVTGVGFLGAGTILHSRGHISGLTSAATIWLVAAIGMAVGNGALLEAAGATLLVILVLAALGLLERRLRIAQATNHVVVEVGGTAESFKEVEEIVRSAGAEVVELNSERHGDRYIVDVVMRGPQQKRDRAKLGLLRFSGAYSVHEQE